MKPKQLQQLLDQAVNHAKSNCEGKPASFIPELANVDPEITSAALSLGDGTVLTSGDTDYRFTLQSTAKVVLLIGLLEEFGQEQVFNWIGVEPTGDSFGAIDYSDRFTDKPSNPLINAGSIALSSHIPGNSYQEQLAWLDHWMNKLFNTKLSINHRVYTSEFDSSDHNRSLAYLMRSKGVIDSDIEQTIKVYTTLCSYEANIAELSHLPMLLAHQGINCTGKRIISEQTVKDVVSILATCGLYNETGLYLLRTGMPAKSGVSGAIMAVGIGQCGLAVFSPRLTEKGGSVRGQLMLEYIAKQLGTHFALLKNH